MVIDGKGILLVHAILAVLGFIGGAIASIWLGPIAMLWGVLGLPGGAILIVLGLFGITALRRISK